MIVLSVIGTRPEAIKMAPVLAELGRRQGAVRSLVCVTGQHQEMLDPILELFRIRPDFTLNVMQPGQSLAGLTAVLIQGLDGVVDEARPDWVLAQGDTTTVLAASLAANFHRARFGHVEAGLRTGDKLSPFPEELNRRIVDVAADALFAPTERARQCLIREGCDPSTIHVTGNTVIDALLDVAARPFEWKGSRFHALAGDNRIVLVTAHRRESFGEPFRQMCEAVRELATGCGGEELQFIFPVHLNPNVREPVNEILGGVPNVSLVEPVDYLSMVQLMKRATLILTDSGGIQEEAPSLGVPVLVMRDTTERPEGVEAGLVRLVGTDRRRIVAETRRVLDGKVRMKSRSPGQSPYGDGKAAARIVAALLGGSRIARPPTQPRL